MIDTLTNDMVRLCGEIAALREGRAVLRGNLADGRNDLKDAVTQMQSDLRSARADMASETKAKLHDFVSSVQDAVVSLKEGISAVREQNLGDIAGARRAWCVNILGQKPASRARTVAAAQPKEQAAPQAKEEAAPQPKEDSARAKKKKRWA